MWHNPVMLIVEVGALFTTVLAVADPSVFAWLITAWLWATVVFANLAEAVAEGRGKAQADTLRRTRQGTVAHRVTGWRPGLVISAANTEEVAAPKLDKGDIVVVDAGEIIPGDGDVIEGIASVDESAITGESAPVIRESGGDRSAVTGGTKVLSDRIVVRITQTPGESFIDRMISLVEGANRQKTPNEIALNILLAALTIVFLMAVVTLQPLAIYAKSVNAAAPDTAALDGNGVTGVVLVALLVCLIPTTIGALLSAIGIAGMDRLVQRNVLAMSGRAVEAAGDVNTLLLDKTGTITLGNRQAVGVRTGPRDRRRRAGRRCPAVQPGRRDPGGPLHRRLRQAGPRAARAAGPASLTHATWVPFTAQTRMSGVDLGTDGPRRSARAPRPRSCTGSARTAAIPPPTSGVDRGRDQRGRRHPAGGRREDRRTSRPGPWGSSTSRTW